MLESLINRYAYYPEHHWIATPAQLGLTARDVSLVPDPGVELHAWFFPCPQATGPNSDAQPLATLLFCHGNAGNISHRLDNVARLVKVGFQVLLFDYRGYGHSTGDPSEQGLYRDARTAWDCMIAQEEARNSPALIFGRSLGGAVAVELALSAQASGLILESTFTSFQTLARLTLPIPLPELPVKYDSLSKITEITMPLLSIHGECDELIPLSDGRTLFQAAPEPKAWYPIPGAGHNDTYLVGGAAYLLRLIAFAQGIAGRHR